MGDFCGVCGTVKELFDRGDYCPECKGPEGPEEIDFFDGDGDISTDDVLFPFDNIREGQKDLLDDVERSFESGKTLLAHAPTGIGKTAAVLPPAIRNKGKGQKVFFLTSKQSQHNIAVETVRNMPEHVKGVDVISKKDMCIREASDMSYTVFEKFCSGEGQERCNLFGNKMSDVVDELRKETVHVSDSVDLCETFDVCPHMSSLLAGRGADIIICDYNYVFSDIRERVFELLEMELEDAVLIVDEAHNLPDRIRGNLEESVTMSDIETASSLFQGRDMVLSNILDGLCEELNQVTVEEKRVSKKFFDDKLEAVLMGGLSPYGSVDDLLPDLKSAATDIVDEDPSAVAPMKVYSFLDSWQNEGQDIFRSIEGPEFRISVKLLDPSRYSREVFERAAGSVLMSGTLYPGDMYADILGVSCPEIKRYSSTFPEGNRKIVSLGNLTTAYDQRGLKMYQAYANSIADVVKEIPGNLAVFFPSYDFLESVCQRLNKVHLEKKMLVEERGSSKEEKEQLVARLRKGDDNILLGVQGGSLSEGVDYKNNILSSVMIVGIPFPPPSLEVEALEEYYSSKFDESRGYRYSKIYPAMNRVLQAAGRPIRGKDDRALIVLADRRFNYQKYRNNLPPSFYYTVERDLVGVCEEFF